MWGVRVSIGPLLLLLLLTWVGRGGLILGSTDFGVGVVWVFLGELFLRELKGLGVGCESGHWTLLLLFPWVLGFLVWGVRVSIGPLLLLLPLTWVVFELP